MELGGESGHAQEGDGGCPVKGGTGRGGRLEHGGDGHVVEEEALYRRVAGHLASGANDSPHRLDSLSARQIPG